MLSCKAPKCLGELRVGGQCFYILTWIYGTLNVDPKLFRVIQMITKILQVSVQNILIFFTKKKLQGGNVMVPTGVVFEIWISTKIITSFNYIKISSKYQHDHLFSNKNFWGMKISHFQSSNMREIRHHTG